MNCLEQMSEYIAIILFEFAIINYGLLHPYNVFYSSLKKKILGYFSCINDKSHAKFAKGNNIAFCPLSINC